MARTKQTARKNRSARVAKQIVAKRQLPVKMKSSPAKCSTPKKKGFERAVFQQACVPRTGPSSPTKQPADMIIFVSGPCLHPKKKDPIASQRKEFHTYFGQFGRVTGISSIDRQNAKISFDNCDSVAKCLQQDKHKIRGQDFIVCKEPVRTSQEKETLGKQKQNLGANLRQNMPGASSENLSAPNVQSDPPAEPNLGNQSPQSITSSSSQVQGSAMDCTTISEEWPQSHDLASFDKLGYK